jgi:integration host factor subunit beta
MTKRQLIDCVAQRGKISKSMASIIVNLVFDGMTEELAEGGRVEIRGFGSFTTREYKGYTGRDPGRGNTVEVKPKRSPFFKAGKELKERLKFS